MAKTPEEWVNFIVERADTLRAAGVLQVQFDGVSFALSPAVAAEPEWEPGMVGDSQWEPGMVGDSQNLGGEIGDPFDDPHTYGLGGRVPGFPRRDEELDDA